MTHEFAGSRWWKFDFHTHTPASRDTPYWQDAIGTTDEVTPEKWLQKFMDIGIDCVAVTDHNSGEWIDRLKAAYLGMKASPGPSFRELVLFPGVELSVSSGVHILAIFDTTATSSDIARLLGAVKFTGTFGNTDDVTVKSLSDVLEAINNASALAIPAHVDKDKGLLQVRPEPSRRTLIDAQTVSQTFSAEAIIAFESITTSSRRPAIFEDAKRSGKIRWTEVIGSDCHSFRGDRTLGRFTWVKMGQPSLEGLRLALLDGSPLSIRRYDEVPPVDPRVHADLCIESIEIKNARHAGRDARPLSVAFSPWLSTLIGGRGTGKSTIVEFLRLGMQRGHQLSGEIEKAFKRFRQLEDSADGGVLREDTSLEIIVRKGTGRYRIHWSYAHPGGSIEEEGENGQWIPSPGDIANRFPIRVFSQKEVFALAENPRGLFNIINDDPSVGYSEWRQQREATEAQYKRLRIDCRDLAARVADLPKFQGEKADLDRQIRVFETDDNREVLQKYQRMRRQRGVLDARIQELRETESAIRRTASEIIPSDLRTEDFDPEAEGDAAAIRLINDAFRAQDEAAKSVIAVADKLRRDIESLNTSLESSRWAVGEAACVAAYEALVERLKTAGVADPGAYATLVARRTTVMRQIAVTEVNTRRIAELDQETEKCLEKLALGRIELAKARNQFLDAVLVDNPLVNITVVPFGASAADAESEFRSAISRPDKAYESDILTEDQSSGLLSEIYRGLPESADEREKLIVTRIAEAKTKLTGVARRSESPDDLGMRFKKYLKDLKPEQVDQIDLWWPDDSVRVEYKSPDGGFLSIQNASPGQKSAAILAFILSHGSEPIVLDQPEDDLDNHLISDLIVASIRNSKRKRQIIVATHNPNIVVNGDAEMVIALKQERGECRLIEDGTGCLQQRGVREEICRVMEGGRKAFKERYDRIVREVGDV